MIEAPFIEVRHLSKTFQRASGWLSSATAGVRAVDDVSFSIRRGETLGLVGESGCGKTTTGRLVMRLVEPTSGEVLFDGVDLRRLDGRALRTIRRRMQIVFQDPMSSLNPRMTAGDLIAEPLVIHGEGDAATRARRLRTLMDQVGLSAHHAHRFPHEFSGGQRQRIGIARALALSPDFLVLDEAVSALDVSIQAQILNLLEDLKGAYRLTYLFISHDLGVVRHVCDRVAVMYLGRIVELAPKQDIFSAPRHPYTQALLASVPHVGEGKRGFSVVAGDVPDAAAPPPGCRFHPRCPKAIGRCATEEPALTAAASGSLVACHLAHGPFVPVS